MEHSRRSRPARLPALLLLVLALVAALLVPLGVSGAAAEESGDTAGSGAREPRQATAVRGIGALSEVSSYGKISGLVYDEDGNLVDGVAVEAIPWEQPDADPVASAITYEWGDSATHGAYELNVPAGEYVVRVGTGFDYWDDERQWETVYYGGGSGTKVTVGADQDVELDPVTVRPDAGTTLTGTALTSEGAPLPHAEVALVRTTRSGHYGWYTVDWTTTDASGTYTFTGVNRGQRYTVRAYGGWLENDTYVDDADTFLGGSALFADAAHLTVPTGSTGVVAPTFSLVPGSTITGRILDQDGQPFSQWTDVEIYARTASGHLEYLRYSYNDDDGEPGTFTAHRIPRGIPITLYSYDADRYLGDVQDGSQAEVVVIGADQEIYDFGILTFVQSGRLVTGRVVTPDGEPVDGSSVSLLTLDPDDPDDYVRSRTTQTDSDGAYRLYAPWGDDSFTLRIFDGVTDEPVYLGNATTLAGAVKFTSQETDTPYTAEDLVVSVWDARIRGTVVDEAGDAVAGATVRLYESWGGSWYSYDQVKTDSEGRYRFRWLSPETTYVVGASRASGGIEVYAGDDGAVADKSEARQIAPAPGQVVSGVDIALFTPVNSISGEILLPDGDELPGYADVSVRLYQWSDWGDGQGYWDIVRWAYPSGDDLGYGFSGLEEGHYHVAADVDVYSAEEGWSSPYLRTTSNDTSSPPTGPGQPGTVLLPDEGPGMLDITMDPGVPLSGTVTLAGSDPARPLGGVRIDLSAAGGTFYGGTETTTAGTYEVRVPASLALDVSAYGTGLRHLDTEVTAGADGATLDLELASDWASMGDGPVQALDYCLAQRGESTYELGGVELGVPAYGGHITEGARYVGDALSGRLAALAPLTASWSDTHSGLSPDGGTLCVVWNDNAGEDPDYWGGNVYQALVTVDPGGGFDVAFHYNQVAATGYAAKAGHSNGLAPFEPVTRFPDAATSGEDLQDWKWDEDWNQVPNDRGLTSNSVGSDVPGTYVFDFDGFHLGAAPQATSKPTILGEPALGQALTVEPPTWEVDGAATDQVQMTYHWRVNGRPVATGPTYTPQQGDLGGRIIVRVRGYVAGHELGSVYSKRRRVRAEAVATSTTPPSIAGTPSVAADVSAQDGAWELHPAVDPDSVTSRFEWLVGHSDHPESTGTTFRVPEWAAGQTLRVRQRLSADGFAPVTATSAPVQVPHPAPVVNTTAPTLSVEGGGEVRVGSVLQVSPGTWDPSDATLSRHWSVGGLQRNGDLTYTVGQQDLGKRVAVRVTASAPGRTSTSKSTSIGPVLASEESTATITGTVRDDDGTPVTGASWSACGVAPSGGWSCFPGGTTTAQGGFSFDAPVGMTLDITVWDAELGAQSRTVTVPATGQTVEFTYVRPAPPPPNVQVPGSNGTVAGAPSVYYGEAQTFEVTGCVTTDPRWDVEFANGAAPMEGAMTKVEDLQDGLARYRAVIPAFYPNHDFATVSFTVPADCAPGTPPTKVVIYIDPSGIVTDQYGTPLVGATVTLLRSDTSGGQFTTVPTGDTSVMDPDAGLIDGAPGSGAQNPKPTDSVGFFRWDVVEGFYKVRVAHAGCTERTTDEMQVNPPRVDLMVKLQCAGAPAPAAGATIDGDTAGKATPGTVLTANPVPVTAPRTSRLQWMRNGDPIQGATGTTYTVTGEDVGEEIRVQHTAKAPDYVQEEGRGAAVTFEGSSALSEVVTGEPAPAPVATVLPGIAGTAKTGGTLTATVGQWNTDGLTFARQWLRDGTPILGATAATYQVTPDDVGQPLAVRVTASKTGSADGTATSESVTPTLGDAPTATTAPAVTGTPTVGSTLTASNGAWTPEASGFALQWLRNGVAIPGATASTYKVTVADAATALSVRVTASRAGHAPGTATSAARAVGKIATRTTLKAPKKVTAGKAAVLQIGVTATGAQPTGKVRVFLGKKAVKTVTLQKGKATVRLKLKTARSKLRAVYLGAAKFAGSTSATVTVKRVAAR